MSDGRTKPDSPLVNQILNDGQAVAELIDLYGRSTVAFLAFAVRELRGELESARNELARVKLELVGIREDHKKLQGQLKSRFAGIDSRLVVVEQRKAE